MKQMRWKKKEQELNSLYQRWNQRFFGGRLPDVNVVLEVNPSAYPSSQDSLMMWSGTGGVAKLEDKEISIALDLSDRDKRRVLLHEMVHFAAPGDGHGPQFQRQIRRLRRLGFKFKIDWRGARKRALPSNFAYLGLMGCDSWEHCLGEVFRDIFRDFVQKAERRLKRLGVLQTCRGTFKEISGWKGWSMTRRPVRPERVI